MNKWIYYYLIKKYKGENNKYINEMYNKHNRNN